MPPLEVPELIYLSPMDNIKPRNHITPKLLFFSATKYSDEAVIGILKRGLSKTIHAIPAIAGTVQLNPYGPQQGQLMISAPWLTLDELLTVKYHRSLGSHLDYVELRARHFPMEALDAGLFIPRPDVVKVEKPAMLAQINMIPGGLILGFSFHHSFVDGPGEAVVLKKWAALCSGENGSKMLSASCLKQDWR